MDWADDLFSLKKSAKKGRRAAAAAAATEGTPITSRDSTVSSPDIEKLNIKDDSDEFDQKSLPKTKKSSGWSEEITPKMGKSKTPINVIELERFNSITSGGGGNLSDDDIPIIPDLDDIQDELILNEMVEAPTVSVNRVATYNELNSDLMKQGVFSSLEDIDLSTLGKCLQNELHLEEPDEIWSWDHLFTEISAEIHADKKFNENNATRSNDSTTNNIDIQTQFVH